MQPPTSREKWTAIGIGLVILIVGSLYLGARWQRARSIKEISHQEEVANNLSNSATQHANNVDWYTGQILKQQNDINEKTKALEQANIKSAQADKKLKDLINSNADINQRYDQALVVIQDKDEVIGKQLALMQNKDQIIDSMDKRHTECQAAYTEEKQTNDALRKALDHAKNIREIKWTFVISYDPIKKDPGASVDRHFEMFNAGVQVDRVTLDNNVKENRFKIRVGFSL